MNHLGGSSCVDEILKPTRERKYELHYGNLACEHPGTFLIKAISELNRGRGGGGEGEVGGRSRWRLSGRPLQPQGHITLQYC